MERTKTHFCPFPPPEIMPFCTRPSQLGILPVSPSDAWEQRGKSPQIGGRETAAEIEWRRANFVALGRRAEAGEAPPPVALSDTAAECRMRGGEVRIDSGSGTRICLGLDRSGTFCLVDSGDAFPCRGLFKHVRRCNDVYHRPALNAFICGERCGADETARGKGCE